MLSVSLDLAAIRSARHPLPAHQRSRRSEFRPSFDDLRRRPSPGDIRVFESASPGLPAGPIGRTVAAPTVTHVFPPLDLVREGRPSRSSVPGSCWEWS